MLRFLRIRNLAVIESVDVEFEPGFNVLTGETGAGKSIVVEAVGLLLGARASAGPGSHGRDPGHHRSHLRGAWERGGEPHELVIRRDITRSRPEPVVYQRGAGNSRSAARPVAAARRTPRSA